MEPQSGTFVVVTFFLHISVFCVGTYNREGPVRLAYVKPLLSGPFFFVRGAICFALVHSKHPHRPLKTSTSNYRGFVSVKSMFPKTFVSSTLNPSFSHPRFLSTGPSVLSLHTQNTCTCHQKTTPPKVGVSLTRREG